MGLFRLPDSTKHSTMFRFLFAAAMASLVQGQCATCGTAVVAAPAVVSTGCGGGCGCGCGSTSCTTCTQPAPVCTTCVTPPRVCTTCTTPTCGGCGCGGGCGCR